MSCDCQHIDSPSAPSGCSCSSVVGSTSCRHSRSRVIQFLEKRTYDFSDLSGGTELYVVLKPVLDVADYAQVKLAIRIHALTMSSGQLLRFYLWGTLPSDEDPGQDFVDTTEFLSLDITSGTSAPALVTSRATSGSDAFLKISLRATQTTAPTPFLATLSACLQLRDR